MVGYRTGSALQQARGLVNLRRSEVMEVVEEALSAKAFTNGAIADIRISLREYFSALRAQEKAEKEELRACQDFSGMEVTP